MKAKYILGLLLLVLSCEMFGTVYYISNDGKDSNSGRLPTSPWKTLNKVNNYQFARGDNIYFKAGDVFYGAISVNNSDLTFSSYGTGEKPVINGMKTLNSWKNEGEGIYSSAIEVQGELRLLTINENIVAKGRYPNEGFLHHESANARTSITDNELTGTWIGGEAVIEVNHWVLSINEITNQTGGTIYYEPTTRYVPRIGSSYGYFIQNHINTLDEFGEWCVKGNKVFIYFGNKSPQSVSVKIAYETTLIDIDRKNKTKVTGLALKGCNEHGIRSYLNNGTIITDCEISYAGVNGIFIKSCPKAEIQQCNIFTVSGNGIDTDASEILIRDNKISSIGLLEGLGAKDGSTYHGINNTGGGTKTIIEYNIIDSTGYNGISCFRDNFEVRYNKVSHTNCLLNDGGGIYTYLHVDDSSAVCRNRYIHHNVVSGVKFGNGIYSDGFTNHLKVFENTIYDIQNKNGIYCNNPRNNEIYKNNIANCNGAGIYMHNLNAVVFAYGNKIHHNTIYKKDDNTDLIKITDDYDQDVYGFGVADSNLYIVNTENSNALFHIRTNNPWRPMDYSFQQWKNLGYDKNSELLQRNNCDLVVNTEKKTKNFTFTTQVSDILTDETYSEFTLPPFTSKFVVKPDKVIQNLEFVKGWNYMATYLLPDDADLMILLNSLIESDVLEKVIDKDGNILNLTASNGWENNIGDVHPLEGYKIKVKRGCSLNISGNPVSLPVNIEFKNGWNFISMPYQESKDPMLIFKSLIDAGDLVKIKDEKGNSIEYTGEDSGWMNNIGLLLPGEPYEIYFQNDVSFSFN